MDDDTFCKHLFQENAPRSREVAQVHLSTGCVLARGVEVEEQLVVYPSARIDADGEVYVAIAPVGTPGDGAVQDGEGNIGKPRIIA